MSGEAAARSDIDLPGRAAAADRRGQGDRQAVRGRALQRPPADAVATSTRRRRRSSRPGSRASRPATPSPTCSSARSTRAASCRSPSRARSARSRSTTTTSRPAGRATRRRSTTRATATSHSCDPLYAFGFGLSYTTFEVSNLQPELADGVARTARSPRRSTSPNTGTRAGDDVVQLYIHDPVASISQPVRRLRGFQRVTLAPGRDADRHVHARRERLRLLRQPAASSSSSPGRSTSTPATARRPT